jgi:hypothetical protein
MAREYVVREHVRLSGAYVGRELRELSALIAAEYAADPQAVRIIFPENKTLRIQEKSELGTAYETLRTPLYFYGISDLTIDGEGATILQDAGEFTLGQYSLPWGGLRLEGCDDFAVSDFYYDGQANNLTRDPLVTEQQCHGVYLGGCRRGTLQNVRVKDVAGADAIILHYFVGAGWSTDTPIRACSFIEATDCIFDGAARNNLSVTAAMDCGFERCAFINAGRHNYGGHSPVAGIDIEADRYPGDGGEYEPTERTGRIRITKCLISNNAQRSIVAYYQRHEDCTLEDSTIIGPDDGVNEYETLLQAPGMIVRRNSFWGYGYGFGHSVEGSTYPGDDSRRSVFEDNIVMVRGGGRFGIFGGQRCDVQRNFFGTRGLGLFIVSVQDGSVVSNNTFHRYEEGFDGLATGIVTLSDCGADTVIDANSFTHGTTGYAPEGEDQGTMYVQLDGTTPDPTNSLLGENVSLYRAP